ESAKRQGPSFDLIKKRVAEVEGRLANVSRELEEKFPDYAALLSPQALPARDLQLLLRSDEALVQYLLTEMDCFVWVVTHDDIRWIRLNTDVRKLSDLVMALRHQLNTDRFNLNVSYGLYQAILEPVEGQLKDKHLFIVPSGALTSLPLHLLVTKGPRA